MKLERLPAASMALALTLGMIASPVVAHAQSSAANVAAAPAPSPSRRAPHASLQVEVGKGKAWVGQAIPIKVTALFRDVQGVTVEGALQLASRAVMTSEIAREPHQATEIRDGQPVLAVTWTGTVTPSVAGPLDLSVDLPVRLRYREATPEVAVESVLGDDPFGDFDADPFGSSIFRQMRQRMAHMMAAPSGRVREEALTLKAASPALEAIALPTAGRPADFSGAVGRFDVTSAVPPARVSVSDPVTLRVVVTGSGDLDRVELQGVPSSDTWKAYPAKVVADPQAAAGRPARKVFEQMLVPLHGGEVSIPAVSVTAFDPSTQRYVTRSSSPIGLTIDGATAPRPADVPVDPAPATAPATTGTPATTSASDTSFWPILPSLTLPSPRLPALALPGPRAIGVGLAVLALPLLALLVLRLRRRHGEERALRRRMRRAARDGSAGPFFDAAHRLIETRLADRWGVRPDQVTAQAIHERLGAAGDPLVELIAADDALRFGRGGLEPGGVDLLALRSSVEQSLGGVLS